MLRYILAPLAAVVLLTACLIPDDAEARRGGGAYRGGRLPRRRGRSSRTSRRRRCRSARRRLSGLWISGSRLRVSGLRCRCGSGRRGRCWRPLLAVLRTAVTATTPTATGFAATNPSSLALGAQPASTSRSTPGAVMRGQAAAVVRPIRTGRTLAAGSSASGWSTASSAMSGFPPAPGCTLCRSIRPGRSAGPRAGGAWPIGTNRAVVVGSLARSIF